MQHPIYAVNIATESSLLTLCEPFLKMDEKALLALLPPQGGFFFGDCPNCDQGDQDNQFTWNLELGEKVQCKYCKVILPSEEYPENGSVSIVTPTGKQQVFKYFQDEDGKKYWLEGRRWYEQRELLSQAAYWLAQLYTYDKAKYAEAGRRATLILRRYTELYPDYILRFDFPGKDKAFFNGNDVTGYNELPDGPYSIAKWSWWAYMDVSRELLLAYDLLYDSSLLNAADKAHIEKNLFSAMLDFVAQYDNTQLTNMHPVLWASQLIAARVLQRPALTQQVIAAMRKLIREEFTYDGVWNEGTPTYHVHTAYGLKDDLSFLRPDLKDEAFDSWHNSEYPDLARAINAAQKFRLPNGNYAAIHDSWADQSYGTPMETSSPQLLPGMGYAILGMESGANQLQAHLNFSGRFGHSHYDSLNLLLFGAGRELISDLGYTHTKARGWTMAAATHNTVLIDGLNQLIGMNQLIGVNPARALGNLRVFNVDDPHFQVVEAENVGAYEKLATTYQRALIAVEAPDNTQYVVDVFDVAGGTRHDWMLHGNADESQNVELTDNQGQPLALQPLASLLPADFNWQPAKSQADIFVIAEGQWAWGYFRDLKTTRSDNTVVATFRNEKEPQGGLRSWILGAPASTLTTARSWNVRGTKEAIGEDDSKLDDHLRTSLIVRRDAAQNQFVAVHHPSKSTFMLRRVTQLPLSPDGFALKIEREDGTDYLLFGYDAKERSGSDGDLKFAFNGRVALAQFDGTKYLLKMIDGTSFQFGTQLLKSTPVVPMPILKAEDNRFTIQGRFPIAPGAVLLITHGNGRSTAFHVAKVTSEGDNTVIETEEPAVFAGSANETWKMLTFPHLELPAPHLASTNVLASNEPNQFCISD